MSDLGPSTKGLRAQDAGASTNVPPGAFNWATVYTFGDKEIGQVKCACVSGTYVYSTSRAGVKRWDTKTGSSSEFIPSGALPGLIHAITVVGSTIWACTGDGKVALYDVTTGEQKAKTFAAHQGEVLCIAAGPGNAYVLTGGIDFTIKSWQVNGAPIAAATYHRGAVECLLVTPMSSQRPSQMAAGGQDGSGKGAKGGGGGKVWSGSADGTMFCWPDATGNGQLKESEGSSFIVEGGKVKSLAASEDWLWVGMDDGRIHIVRLTNGILVKTLPKAHSGPVLTMLHVAGQIWSGSGDKTIAVHDATPGRTPVTLFSLGDQGSYVKGLLPYGWCVWTFTASAIKIYTAEALWQLEIARAESALSELDQAQDKLKAAAAEVAEAREGEAWGKRGVEEANAAAAQSKAELTTLQDQLSKIQAQADATVQELQNTQKELEAARGAAVGLRSQLADVQTALEKEKTERAKADGKAAVDLATVKAALEAELTERAMTGDAAAAELAGLRAQLAEMEVQVQARVAELAEAQTTLEKEKTERAKADAKAAADVVAVKAALEAERTERAMTGDAAAAELATAGAVNAELEQALQQALKDLDAVRAAVAAAQEERQRSEEALRSELKVTQTDREADQAEVTKLREEKNRLEQQVAEQQLDSGALNEAMFALREEFVSAYNTSEQIAGSLKGQLDKAHQELADALRDMGALRETVASLREELETARATGHQTADSLQRQLEETQAELADTVSRLQAGDSEVKKLKAAAAVSSEAIQQAAVASAAMQQKMEEVRSQLHASQAHCSSLSDELDGVREQLQQTGQQLADKTDEISQLEILLEEALRKYAGEEAMAKQQRTVLAEGEAVRAALTRQLEEAHAAAVAAHGELQAEVDALKNQLLAVEDTGQEAAREREALAQELVAVQEALNEADAKAAAAEAKVVEVQAKAAAAEAKAVEVEAKAAEAEANQELLHQLSTVQEALEEAEAAGKKAARERDDFARQLVAVRGALEAKAVAAEAAERQAQLAEATVAELKRHLEEGDARESQAAARCEDLARKLHDAERRAEAAEAHLAAEQNELSSLRTQGTRLAAETAALTAAALIREKIEEELERLRARIRDAETGLPRCSTAASPASPCPPSPPHTSTRGSGSMIGGSSPPASPLPSCLSGPSVPEAASASSARSVLKDPGVFGTGGLLRASSSKALEEQLGAQENSGVAGLDGGTGGYRYQVEMAAFLQQLETLRTSSQVLENLVRGLRSTFGDLREGSAQAAIASLLASVPAGTLPSNTKDTPIAKVQADEAALQAVQDKGIREQALSKELEECRSAKAALDVALTSCQAELNEVLEDRYQLQVAVRAMQKQLADTQTAAASAERAAERAEAEARAAAATSPDPETAARMVLLEGALRQTKHDYKALLTEVSSIRAQLAAKDGLIAQQAAELSRLMPQIDDLKRQIAEVDLGGRVCNALAGNHSTMQRRLAEARASDEMFNNSFAFNMGAGGAGAYAAGARRERERYLPPTGFL